MKPSKYEFAAETQEILGRWRNAAEDLKASDCEVSKEIKGRLLSAVAAEEFRSQRPGYKSLAERHWWDWEAAMRAEGRR